MKQVQLAITLTSGWSYLC